MKRNYELNGCLCFRSVDLAAKAADYYEGVEHIRFCVIRNEVAKFQNGK